MYWLDDTSLDGATADPGRGAAGARRWFRNENLSLGQEGTEVPAWVLNMLVAELLGVVTGAGITPAKADDGQLLAAINALVGAAAPQTGMLRFGFFRAPAPNGWVLMDDGSIGAAASGATSRAADDCQELFGLLWQITAETDAPETYGPVQTSAGTTVPRGASWDADWTAGRRLILPRVLGRAMFVGGAGAGLTTRSVAARAGAESVTLSVENMPPHDHDGGVTTTNGNQGTGGSGSAKTVGKTGLTGDGTPVSIIPPAFFVNCMIKL